MSFRTISFDNSTDGGAGLRHWDRLQECCSLLSGPGIALEDLHKWSDVFANPPVTAISRDDVRAACASPRTNPRRRQLSNGGA